MDTVACDYYNEWSNYEDIHQIRMDKLIKEIEKHYGKDCFYIPPEWGSPDK